MAEGGCSEYEEITVEVDGDYLFNEEEEESFETEEVTYQVTNNTRDSTSFAHFHPPTYVFCSS